MVRESQSGLRHAAGNLHSVLHRARVWPVPVLAIATAALLAAAQAQPAPSRSLAKGVWPKLAPLLHPQNEALSVVTGNRISVMGAFTPATDVRIVRVQFYS